MQQDVIGIENAKWWLPQSHVVIKEDLLVSDQEWITNQTIKIAAVGNTNGGNGNAEVESRLGSANRLLIERMVVEGVVAVSRPRGRVKTVHLPAEASQLLQADLDYIVEQINALTQPMTAAEQKDFLPGAKGQLQEHLPQAK